MGNLGIWIIVISTFVLGGELEDFHISYLKVDIFMDELFTWIQVSIGDEHRWTIFIGFIGMIFTSHHITTSGNGTHFSGIIYSHSSWPGAKAAKCTVKTAISVGNGWKPPWKQLPCCRTEAPVAPKHVDLGCLGCGKTWMTGQKCAVRKTPKVQVFRL